MNFKVPPQKLQQLTEDPRKTMDAATHALPESSNLPPTRLNAFPAQSATISTTLLPLPALPAHPVSTPTPLHHPPAHPVPKAHTTIKMLPLLSNHAQPARKESTRIPLTALPANFALRVNY